MNWNKIREENYLIEKGCKESFSRGQFNIRCVRGILWITWPGSGDVLLHAGDEISLKTEGILCVTAMTGALMSVTVSILIPRVKDIPDLLIRKSLKAVLSWLKNEENQSVFGDSIHNITR